MFNTIRIKLTFWYAGILGLLVISFALLTYISVSKTLLKETDESLLAMSKNFASAVNVEESGENDTPLPNEAVVEVIKEFKFQDYHLFVFTAEGKSVAKTSEENFSPDFAENSYNSFQLNDKTFRVYATLLRVADKSYKLLIYRNLAEQLKVENQLFYIFLLSIPLMLLVSILFGYLLAKRSLNPVKEISRQAQTITANNLHERLLIRNERDELGNLAGILNNLLDRLENSFEQQRRFMADASHELRTPLAIVRGESEVALSKERSNEDLRESLEIVNDESKRLTKIVEDLFTLSRADAGQFKASFKQVYLDEILSDCLRNIRVLADKKNISLEISSEVTEISGDEQLLRRLFLNLLDNAVKYNRESGKIIVKLADKTITISDTGFGIPENEQAKIFERFYRSDKARTRNEQSITSGAGLGLSISKWIAELNQADLKLSKSDTSGSEFTIKFPANK